MSILSRQFTRALPVVAIFISLPAVPQVRAEFIAYTFGGNLTGDYAGETFEVRYLFDTTDTPSSTDACQAPTCRFYEAFTDEQLPIVRLTGNFAGIKFDMLPGGDFLSGGDLGKSQVFITNDFSNNTAGSSDSFGILSDVSFVNPVTLFPSFNGIDTVFLKESQAATTDSPLIGIEPPRSINNLDPSMFDSAVTEFQGTFGAGFRMVEGTIETVTVEIIPEPSTAMLSAALFALGVMRRRRRTIQSFAT